LIILTSEIGNILNISEISSQLVWKTSSKIRLMLGLLVFSQIWVLYFHLTGVLVS